MNKYIVICLLFVQSAAIIASQTPPATKSVRRTSGPRQEPTKPQPIITIPQKTSQNVPQGTSPFEFSPSAFDSEIDLSTYVALGVLSHRENKRGFSRK